MTTITHNSKNLHCAIDCEAGNWQDIYASAKECMQDITPDIIEDGEANGYTEAEIAAIIDHYAIALGNANGEWKGIN